MKNTDLLEFTGVFNLLGVFGVLAILIALYCNIEDIRKDTYQLRNEIQGTRFKSCRAK